MLPFAVRTGLEPATPGVTGRYSNQLNYRTNLFRLMRFSRTRMQRYAFFLNLQIFLHIFHDFFKKKNKGSGRNESVTAGCSESENSIRTGKKSLDFNYTFFLFGLSLQKFRNPHLEDTVFNTCLNIVFFCIFG